MNMSEGINVEQEGPWVENEEKIVLLEEQFAQALEDYKQAYVLYKINADIPDYKNTLLLKERSLNTLNKDVFLLKNKLQSDIGKVNTKLSKLQKVILLQRGAQRRDDRVYDHIKASDNGAVEMNQQFNENYKAQLLSNWTLFLGILLLFFLIYRFRGSTIQGSTMISSLPATVPTKKTL
jgi:hypothetical protein